MHEAAIAQSIIHTVLEEAVKQEAIKVESVEIEIGELTFLGIDQVEFWVKTNFEGTVAQGATILFKRVKAEIHCNACEFQGALAVKEDPGYHLNLPLFSCPKCESSDIEITRGKEALIRRIHILKQ